MYIKNDELNKYEKENNRISFRTLVNKLFTDMILCNDITKIFYSDINGTYISPEIEMV